eukprot:jgi/Chlat1/822/Chrsp104S08612
MAASTATLGVRAERLTAAALVHAPAAAAALRHNTRDADGVPTGKKASPSFLAAKHAASVATAHPARRSTVTVAAGATATAVSPLEQLKQYERPEWAAFEMGHPDYAVYWESANGGGLPSGIVKSVVSTAPSCAVESLAPWPSAREALYAQIYIRSVSMFLAMIAMAARTLEFSFTDGQTWDGRYKIEFVLPSSLQGKPKQVLDEGLADEMASASACNDAIFPDLVPVLIKCPMPGGVGLAGGDRCDLDITVGCMDPTAVNYDPFAIVDDGKCDISPQK